MSKLIPLEEAAKILGISVDKLTELRSNNEIFGYRDGSTWKFKMGELERVADELGFQITKPAADASAADSGELGLALSDSEELMLAGDSEELKLADDNEPPTIVSKSNDDSDLLNLSDSGIVLEDDDSLQLKQESEELKLEDSGSFELAGDPTGKNEEELSFGSSSLVLSDDGTEKDSPSSTGDDLLAEEKPTSDSDTGDLLGDDLDLEDDLSFAESESFGSDLSSDFDESSDLVLDDSDSSAELLLEDNQSGIALSPNDSGIILEDDEPLELGGSDIDELELPDDDAIVMDNPADSGVATMMQEDNFSLTPHEMSVDEDDSSGSQVIALGDSEIYTDDSAATVLDSSDFAAGGFAPQNDFDSGMAPMDAAVGTGQLPEAEYSLAAILSLGGLVAVMLICSTVAYGMVQNLWLPEDQVVSSGLLNFFWDSFGLK